MKVRPRDCIYVGNGTSNELSGAFESGMYPVLILPPKNAEIYLQPSNDVKDFALKHGKVINNIDEVLSFI